MLPDLEILGFDITNLGNGSYSISSIPAGTEGINISELLQNMICDATEGKVNSAKDDISHIIAHSLAKKSAIPVGQELSQEEMNDIIEKLFISSNPNYTPEGKIISVILEHEKISKLFS